MDWTRAAERHGTGPVGRVFEGTRHLVEVRRSLAALHAATPLEVVDAGDPSLFTFVRPHPSGPLLAVHNMTDAPQALDRRVLETVELDNVEDAISGETPVEHKGTLLMQPYAAWWLRPARRSREGLRAPR